MSLTMREQAGAVDDQQVKTSRLGDGGGNHLISDRLVIGDLGGTHVHAGPQLCARLLYLSPKQRS